jgi:hypothetical protein
MYTEHNGPVRALCIVAYFLPYVALYTADGVNVPPIYGVIIFTVYIRFNCV